ncbi:His Kinase A domain containing protein [Linnemannia exigua]|uniref:histidine kinase n=1 Tax=Linnemannia exigua TaxID=604196 RepID=A0AAD4DN90_9FUNG|nr:His Kinase A domain containing protein [Linnemannia exigua]
MPASSSAPSTASTPSKPAQPTIEHSENLSMLAKPKRDKSSIGPVALSPAPAALSGSDKRISSEGYQMAKNYACQSQQQLPTYLDSANEPDYESWDDFLKAYSQGHFPDDAQILESSTDLNFDRIAQLVGTVLGVNGCMICLVDQENIAIKANYRAPNMECRREVSLSGHAILRAPDDPLVVLDTTKDWRFNGLPAVRGGPLVRFYAGAALSTPDGNNIGSLCVIDPEPRTTFTEKERLLLVDFAAVVMREMTLWNDQVSLCTKTQMMRDMTCWVRACLDMTEGESLPTPAASPEPEFARRGSFEDSPARLSPSPDRKQTSGAGSSIPVRCIHDNCPSPPDAFILPTPNSSPTFHSKELRTNDRSTHLTGINGSVRDEALTGDRLRDKAFPSACNMIQATLGADAVYLVQVGSNKSFLPQAESGVSWNLWRSTTRSKKGAVGTVGGAESLMDSPGLTLECLASSTRQVIDEPVRNARRQGTAWVCAEVGCRPHMIRDFQQEMAEPDWERDLPVISEAMYYVRQLKSAPVRQPAECPLYTCCPGAEENNWFEATHSPVCSSSSRADDIALPGLLCHTFQGTLPSFEAGVGSPYKSCVVMPIRGASSADQSSVRVDEPWAYIVVLSSSPTKQFLPHERIYLKNFGSCLVTEVMKQRIEAADKAKGIFIKNISHELRTPLHIILGILELLQGNTEGTLTELQLMMLGSAEASGKGLIDTINNIIDLADLDANNRTHAEQGRRQLSDLFANDTEVDIRGLCEEVAGSMAKRCVDKTLVISTSWSQSPMASLSSSTPGTAMGRAFSNQVRSPSAHRASMEDSGRDCSSTASRAETVGLNLWPDDHKSSLELLVAMDEPDNTPEEDIHWNFMLNIPMVKRILTQLLENAIKFTTTGFVEISAVSPSLGMFPLKPPQPDSLPIIFTVQDTGKGISPEYVQAHMFERFSQEDPLQAGTGLGLALVKLLVESLGGWLEVWSEGVEGKGCVIRVLIWATTPSTVSDSAVKSLRDEEGPWKGKTCRFFAGGEEGSSVGQDRLWAVVGERMMGRDLGMVVERGREQDVNPEEMIKELENQSSCDQLVFNDDLGRLKAYLSYWRDRHRSDSELKEERFVQPPSLLMLTTINREKKARAMVEAYLKAWREESSANNSLGQHPVRVVILPKPVGPLKLLHALRESFSDITTIFRNNNNNSSSRRGRRSLDNNKPDHAGTTSTATALRYEEQEQSISCESFKVMRSMTPSHTTTLSKLGDGQSNGNGLPCTVESVTKSPSFKLPTSSSFLTPGLTPSVGVGVGVGYFDIAFGSYSPGGPVFPAGSRMRATQDKDQDKDDNETVEQEPKVVGLHPSSNSQSNSDTAAGKIGGDELSLLGETLQTPPQPTPPQMHPDQQVRQQRRGVGEEQQGKEQGQGQEEQEEQEAQEQGQGEPVMRSRSRRTIRNFMGADYPMVESSQSRSRKPNVDMALSKQAAATARAMTDDDGNSGRPYFLRTATPTANTTNPVGPISKNTFPWSDLRILIVEDNLTNRMILKTFLRKKGITVVEAENGQVGVDQFEEELSRCGSGGGGGGGGGSGGGGFDFVLMDLQMPVMDGNMATKRIREAERRMIKSMGLSARSMATTEAVIASAVAAASASAPSTAGGGNESEGMVTASSFASRLGGEGVRVVKEGEEGGGYCPAMIFALTGLASDEDKRLAFECGVDGYLTKPIRLSGLAALLASCRPTTPSSSSA